MSTPSKAYTAAYKEKHKDRLAAQQAERDRKKREAMANDPEAREAYLAKRRQEYLKTHPNAKTMEEYLRDIKSSKNPGKRIRKHNKPVVIIDGITMRVCEACGITKPLEKEFPRHGPRGRKGVCCECSKPVKKSRAKRKEKELPRFVVTTERKPVPKDVDRQYKAWDDKLTQEGWVKIAGHTDVAEWIKAYIRNGVILYVRGTLGSYSTGKQSFGVAFDDSGKRYPTLGAAERVVQKLSRSFV